MSEHLLEGLLIVEATCVNVPLDVLAKLQNGSLACLGCSVEHKQLDVIVH